MATSEMKEAERYRRWLLGRQPKHGWFTFMTQTGKANAAVARMLRDGWLETDDYGMCRITDAGHAALASPTERDGR